MFTEIKKSLHDFGVDFDVYFHENDLHESGAVDRAIARLDELGMMYEQDGARWLRTSDFGDDKDRVVIKSDGEPAYISGDLAYYLDKRERGFDRCLIMLGADHHGYVVADDGDVRRVRRHAQGQPRDPDRPAGQPGARRRAAADEQAGRHRPDAGGPRRGDRRRRLPLRAGALLDGLDDRPRPRPVGRARPATTRSSTCSTPTRGCRRSSATPPTSASCSTRRRSTRRCWPSTRRARCCARWRTTRRSWPAPPSCASRTGSPATSRTPPRRSTSSTTCAHVLPKGDEEPTDLHRARLMLVAATRQVIANGLGLLGVTRPGADV